MFSKTIVSKTIKVSNLAILFLLALLLVACSSSSHTSQVATTTSGTNSVSPTPAPMDYGKVDVGGYELFFQCIGQGTPTVILEAGASSGAGYWLQVLTGGDRNYRICSYDRANIPPSDEAPTPRTYQDMGEDLHALLVNANISGPYILVGHSGGGLVARVFTAMYPQEIVGLVLVDSAHPDMGVRLLADLPPKSMFESREIRFLRQWFSWMSDSDAANYPYDSEGMDNATSNMQVKNAEPLGVLPLVVISRNPGDTSFTNVGVSSDLPADTSAKLIQTWQDLQSELVGWSSNSSQVFARGGHNIPTDEPELIIDAIRKLVDEYRSTAGEANSSSLPEGSTGTSNHTPVIARTEKRQEENKKGNVTYYVDIAFTDIGGDATAIVNKVISYHNPDGAYPFIADDNIMASAEEQKGEALVTSPLGCNPGSTLTMEYRILDKAGNLSEPVMVSFSCPETRNQFNIFLFLGLAGGIGVVALAAWLLIRLRNSKRP